MRQFLILLTAILFVIPFAAHSQTAEDSVKAVINKLFEGMKLSDTVLLKQAFSDSAMLQTIVQRREGQTLVRTDKVSGFISAVGSMPKDSADERIIFESIKIDGPLASVWTPYRFYYAGKFSHCGVNSFQLVRINGIWRIQYLIDTRRRTGCE